VLGYVPLERDGRCFAPLLVRSFSLFSPDELVALRVAEARVLAHIWSLPYLQTEDAGAPVSCATPTTMTRETPSALRLIAWGRGLNDGADSVWPCAAFLLRHAPTLTELDGQCPGWDDNGRRGAFLLALACCTRLESLTCAYSYASKLWLGLTQLHTLRGVDLVVVSISEIAAALPRLHTLDAFLLRGDARAMLAGFIEHLLPRLRVLHFLSDRLWFRDRLLATSAAPPQPLPLLQELVWDCPNPSTSSFDVAPCFLRARPLMVRISLSMIAKWLTLGGTGWDTPLARVRALYLIESDRSGDASPTARILRAAPQLRTLTSDSSRRLSVFAEDALDLEGVVHPRLRSIHINPEDSAAPSLAVDCAARLQQRHFPRLREVVVGDDSYFVTPFTPLTLLPGHS
jgi:hypothetical protein